MTQPWQPFFATRAQRVALARERFFATGERVAGLVDPLIAQSWARSRDYGLSPRQVPVFDAISRSRMQDVLDRSPSLLQAAAPELDRLDQMLAGTASKVVLTDARCMVVRSSPRATGAGALLDDAGRQGVSIQEKLVGSSASAICVAADQAVRVDGGEHFFEALQQVHCAAAPLRNAGGSLAGTLLLSREGGAFRFDAVAMARQFAAAIERRLFLLQAAGSLLLRFQASAQWLDTPLEGLAAADDTGRIACINPAGQALLALEPEDLAEPQVEPLFGLSVPQLLARLGDATPRLHGLPNGLQVWLLAEVCQRDLAPARAPQPQAGAGAPSALRGISRQLIADTVQSCGGNISAAARVLKVSRGLLYRHLRETVPPG